MAKYIEIFIDGQIVPVSERDESALSLSYSIEAAEDISKLKGSSSKRNLSIPAEKTPEALFRDWADGGTFDLSGANRKKMRIDVNGATVFSGTAQLAEAETRGGAYGRIASDHKVELIGSNAAWFEFMSTLQLRDLEGLMPSHIATDAFIEPKTTPIIGVDTYCYFLAYWKEWNIAGEVSYSEHLPGVFAWAIVKESFRLAGYAVKSDFFFMSDMGQRLIMPVTFRDPLQPSMSMSQIRAELFVADFLLGLTHAFGLVWDTDILRQTVTVEPRDDWKKPGIVQSIQRGFYGRNGQIDASKKQDLSKRAVVRALSDPDRSQVLSWKDADDANAERIETESFDRKNLAFLVDFNNFDTLPPSLSHITIFGDQLNYDPSENMDPSAYYSAPFSGFFEVEIPSDSLYRFFRVRKNGVAMHQFTETGTQAAALGGVQDRIYLNKGDIVDLAGGSPNGATALTVFLFVRPYYIGTLKLYDGAFQLDGDRFANSIRRFENPFFSKTAHMFAPDIKHPASTKTPQIPVLRKTLVGEPDPAEIDGDLEPRLLYFAGRRGGADGLVANPNAGGGYDFPAAYMVNYNGDETDACLSFGDCILPNGTFAVGLMRRFHLQNLKRIAVGKQAEEWVFWDEIDLLALDWRKKIWLNEARWILQKIDGFKPTRFESTKTVLLLDASPDETDAAKIESSPLEGLKR